MRYGVRVEQPDGGIVAGLEASLRAGLAHVRRTAESLRSVGRNTPGDSVHAAYDLLAAAVQAGPRAEGATLPPAASTP